MDVSVKNVDVMGTSDFRTGTRPVQGLGTCHLSEDEGQRTKDKSIRQSIAELVEYIKP